MELFLDRADQSCASRALVFSLEDFRKLLFICVRGPLLCTLGLRAQGWTGKQIKTITNPDSGERLDGLAQWFVWAIVPTYSKATAGIFEDFLASCGAANILVADSFCGK